MVQIKLTKQKLRDINYRLIYIPYGSDKTTAQYKLLRFRRVIYIPYGSDKTWVGKVLVISGGTFISHMVQIKPFPPFYNLL